MTLLTMGGPGPTTSGELIITIERWSTPDERHTMHDALATKGTDGLVSAMEKYDLGYIQLAGSLGRRLRVASTFMGPKGRVIRGGIDRPMLLGETVRNTRSLDYPIGVFEFTLPNDGSPGEGTFHGATRLGFDKEGSLVIETLPGSTAPQRLLSITKMDAPKKKPDKD